MHEIHTGDVLDVLKTLPDESFQGSLSDPPYELGFMGKKWDGSGIAFSPELWSQMYRVLESGSYLLAFGGARTFHRLTCAIEDAGFHVVDHLMWLHAQGFPKGKSQLKPGYEPIILARKPAKKVLALNIDACRINPGEKIAGGSGNWGQWRKLEGRASTRESVSKPPHTLGRWPANVILDESAAELLDAQSGEIRAGGTVSPDRKNKTNTIFGKYETVTLFESYNDVGGASRFFFCAKAGKDERKNNSHPTIKPLKLTTWLASLIRRDGRILVPFSGSGSEMVGAVQAGWSEVIGIERAPEYVRIAERRLCQS